MPFLDNIAQYMRSFVFGDPPESCQGEPQSSDGPVSKIPRPPRRERRHRTLYLCGPGGTYKRFQNWSADPYARMARLGREKSVANRRILRFSIEAGTFERGELRAGDVLAVARRGGLYEHYGVYAGGGVVIHYAAKDGDFGGRITVHETTLAAFQGDSPAVCVLDFPEDSGHPSSRVGSKWSLTTPMHESAAFARKRAQKYHLYSPEETVARAKARVGEESYSLPANNCEHFAIWCKTGVHESHQVNKWASLVGRILPFFPLIP